jgi:hypothetical protein
MTEALAAVGREEDLVRDMVEDSRAGAVSGEKERTTKQPAGRDSSVAPAARVIAKGLNVRNSGISFYAPDPWKPR